MSRKSVEVEPVQEPEIIPFVRPTPEQKADEAAQERARIQAANDRDAERQLYESLRITPAMREYGDLLGLDDGQIASFVNPYRMAHPSDWETLAVAALRSRANGALSSDERVRGMGPQGVTLSNLEHLQRQLAGILDLLSIEVCTDFYKQAIAIAEKLPRREVRFE